MRNRDWLGLAVIAVLGALLFASARSKPDHARALDWLRSAQARMDVSVPDGAVLFLGDSITHGLTTAAVTPLAVNFGIGAQTSEQLLISMDNYKSMHRAKAVSVLIGTNDIIEGRSQGLKERYSKILAKIPPGVPVIFSSVPPILRPGMLEIARSSSSDLRFVCEQDPRCRFVDLHNSLNDGALINDGVHLDAKGYAIWIELLRQATP